MKSVAIVVGLLAGCSGVDYSLYVQDGEPSQRPQRSIAPTVFINDIETTELHETVDPSSDEHDIIELRYADHVVARYDSPVGPIDCDGAWDLQSASVSVASYASGDLRFVSRYVKARGCTGVGDGFAFPACSSTTCGDGNKCSIRATLLEPLFGKLGCAPVGTKALDEACTFVADGGELVDDCQAGLVCVDGACRETCTQGDCSGCDYVDGMPPELRVCR